MLEREKEKKYIYIYIYGAEKEGLFSLQKEKGKEYCVGRDNTVTE